MQSGSVLLSGPRSLCSALLLSTSSSKVTSWSLMADRVVGGRQWSRAHPLLCKSLLRSLYNISLARTWSCGHILLHQHLSPGQQCAYCKEAVSLRSMGKRSLGQRQGSQAPHLTLCFVLTAVILIGIFLSMVTF